MTEAPTLQLSAYVLSTYVDGQWQLTDQPSHAVVRIATATVRNAEELAARFPKSARLRVYTGPSNPGDTRETVAGRLGCSITLAADGVNGGVNETGIKRLASIIRTARKLGLPVEYGPEGGGAANPMPAAQFSALVGEPVTELVAG